MTVGTRVFDPESSRVGDETLLYNAKDLTTHAVCVGMTGSGKTGLCLSLLEEAALDKSPAILIDPRGDLGNLMLSFPDLAPADFHFRDGDVGRAEARDRERYFADVLFRLGGRHWARADHHFGDLFGRFFSRHAGRYDLAAAQNGRAITEGADFVQFVRDKHQPTAFVAQQAQGRKEGFSFLRGQNRRWLVEDQ